MLRWGASTVAELASADAMAAASEETAEALEVDETTALLVKKREQALAQKHGVMRQASTVGAQLQTVGRAAAKSAGRSVLRALGTLQAVITSSSGGQEIKKFGVCFAHNSLAGWTGCSLACLSLHPPATPVQFVHTISKCVV